MVCVKMVNSETARETGLLLCRIALWDCIKDISASFTTLTKMRGKLGPDSSSKTIPGIVQSRLTIKRSLNMPHYSKVNIFLYYRSLRE